VSEGAVLGIDPGSAKAGFAVLDPTGSVAEAGIAPIGQLLDRLREALARHPATLIALGEGTRSAAVVAQLRTLALPLYLVDEFETTRFARELYFREHPPRGWRRLLPAGMQLPPRPIDDYAAILIARRFLAQPAAARRVN
jgi:RNase H-fold protein (predicted Holliday junction resolvase)